MRIVEVSNGVLQFKFSSKYKMKWVEKNGSWNFDDNLLLLCQWRKGLSAANIVFTHSPFGFKRGGYPLSLCWKKRAKTLETK